VTQPPPGQRPPPPWPAPPPIEPGRGFSGPHAGLYITLLILAILALPLLCCFGLFLIGAANSHG
jgi:hypothetical protein